MGTELRWSKEPPAAGIRVRMEHSYRNPSFTLGFVAPILLYHGRDHEKDISWTTPNEPFLVPHFGAQFCARRTHEIPRKGSFQISSISWITRQKAESRRDDVLFMWISSLGVTRPVGATANAEGRPYSNHLPTWCQEYIIILNTLSKYWNHGQNSDQRISDGLIRNLALISLWRDSTTSNIYF